jgi:predicted transcriptional regulator
MPSKAETPSVRLPDTVKTQPDELARLTKRSRSFIVQEAVSSYVQDRADYMRRSKAPRAALDIRASRFSAG